MNQIELERALRQLRLGGIAAVLETRLRQAQAEAMAPIDLISSLVSDELSRRSERLLDRRRKQAAFRDPHKPCAVPKIITEANGRRRRVYLRWATPFELLQEAPRLREYPAARRDARRTGCIRPNSIRHRSCVGHATRAARQIRLRSHHHSQYRQ